jgi:hypothetical protein
VTVAAIYVEKGGVYYGLDDVDPWDEARDARLYAGPWPVVAHPPCARWCALAGLVEAVHGYKRGDDGGTFEAALRAVRTFGGVLAHPAHSAAWDEYGLPAPARHGWASSFTDPGYASEVDQAAYGHLATKATWLYVVGTDALPALRWDTGRGQGGPAWWVGTARYAFEQRPRGAERMRGARASRTPIAFRDELLGIARSLSFDPRPSTPRPSESTSAGKARPFGATAQRDET